MEERINQLESLAALQDRTIAALNAEVFRQQQDIQRLHKRIDALVEKLGRLDKPAEIAPDEKPPHW